MADTKPRPSRDEIAAIVLAHWPKDVDDPRYPTVVRCAAEGCAWEGRFPGDISEHVADLIVREPTPLAEPSASHFYRAAQHLYAIDNEYGLAWTDASTATRSRYVTRAKDGWRALVATK